MTVSSEARRSGPYNGNGVTKSFPYEFRIKDAGHVKVIQTDSRGAETVLALNVSYAVSGVGSATGGDVTLSVAPAVGERITIVRNVPFVQEMDLENQGAFFSETIEDALDLGVMRDQQLSERLDRAVTIPASANPEALARLIGDVVRLGGSADQINALAGIAGEIETLASVAEAIVEMASRTSQLNIPALASVGEQHLTSLFRSRLSTVVISRSEMAALPVNVIAYRSVELVERGREGSFKWSGQNLSAKISADLSQGLYVAPSFDLTGASGAWVRIYNGPAIVTWWGVDPTGVTDAGGLISRIFGIAEVKWLRFPAGVYRIDTSPDPRLTSIKITGDGKGNTILNFGNAAAKFQFNGSISALPNLSAYMRTERGYASFNGAHGLAPNDLFLAFKPAANSYFDSNRPGQVRNYTQAEFFVTSSVTNSTDVQICGRPSDLYGTSDTSMYKVSPISFEMSDLTITGGTAETIIYVLWARGVHVSNVEISTKYYVTFEFDRCFGGVVNGVSCSNSSTAGGMYGVSINSCTDFMFDGGSPSAGRHSIALGQREEVGAGPNRNIRIVNATLRNASNGIGAGDMHGCVENIFYDNCVLDGGLILAGKNVSARNSIIRQIPGDPNGSAVYGSEFLGGVFTLENITFVIHYGNLAYGLIRLSPGATLKQECLFVFRNISVVNQLGYDDTDTNARLIYVGGRSVNMAVNVVVDGLTAMCTNLQAVMYVRDEELPTFKSDFLAVDNALIKCGGEKYCIFNTTHIAGVKTRELATQGIGGGLSLAWPN